MLNILKQKNKPKETVIVLAKKSSDCAVRYTKEQITQAVQDVFEGMTHGEAGKKNGMGRSAVSRAILKSKETS